MDVGGLNNLASASTQAPAGHAYSTRVMKTAIDSMASQDESLLRLVDQADGKGRNVDTRA